MKKRTPVSEIMTKDLITVNTTNSVMDVVQIFMDKPIHHVPVVSGDQLLGIISKVDIDRVSFVAEATSDHVNTSVYNILSIEQVMTKQVESVDQSDTIKSAAELLAKGQYHALPVLQDNKLAGIVTSTDVIKYLLDQY